MIKRTLVALLLVFASGAGAELEQAHDFRLKDISGDTFRLSDALETGPVILDFWATWCAPCKIALPRWQELAERYADHGVRLVTISQDDPRSQPKIRPYMRSQGFEFPALLDGDKQVGRKFRVTTLPTTFLIGADGSILMHHVGYREGDEHEFESALRTLLELPEAEGESR